jgi:hypothetical protein
VRARKRSPSQFSANASAPEPVCARPAHRSDMDFMFGFFKRMHKEQLAVTDLHFSSHTTFRKYVDELCSQENSGWTRVVIPVEVEGFRHLKARAPGRVYLPPARLRACPPPLLWPTRLRPLPHLPPRRSILCSSCTATPCACSASVHQAVCADGEVLLAVGLHT